MLDIDKINETMQKSRFIKMVARYQHLISNLHVIDISKCETFQRTYNCFFQLRRNENYRRQHFEFMEANKFNKQISFKIILNHLSNIQNTVEASFASKMLSIINPDMPVLDSKVLQKLSLKKPSPISPKKIDETIQLYDKICDWYKAFKNTNQYTQWIKLFNQHFPNSGISDVKKIDFVLWQLD